MSSDPDGQWGHVSLLVWVVVFSSLAFLSGFYLHGLVFAPKGSSVVVVENKSSHAIVQGKIEGCDREFDFKDLRKGDYVVFAHLVDCVDSHYAIQVTKSSGKELSLKGGYVTHGYRGTLGHLFEVHGREISYDPIIYHKEESQTAE